MSDSPARIQNGYLVLADISGYTAFLSQTELDHAHEILTDLLETILTRFKSVLTVHKIEGDAIFAYAPEPPVVRGEALLELIEATYTAFRERMKNVRRHTTCTCRACQSIPTLDLKFMAHHGDFVVQNIGGSRELAGADVNLVHRLLKNHVSENSGWRAYALFTQAALDSMQLRLEGLSGSSESYEHLGEIRVFAMDLHTRYDALLRERRVFLLPGAAHRVLEYDYAAPPDVIWEWFNDPAKRGQWMHSQILPVLRVGGRLAPGARNHCVHGKNEVVVEDLLDIKPYQYYTVDHTPKGNPVTVRMTFEFGPSANGGTHVRLALRCRARFVPDWAARLLAGHIVENTIKRSWALDQIDQLVSGATSP
jgi:uncharacterized protein YndB with AHSA1/START domain/class 3 adenylate cyclase